MRLCFLAAMAIAAIGLWLLLVRLCFYSDYCYCGYWILSNGFGLNGSNPGLHWISSNRIRQKRTYSKKIGDLIGCFPMERSYLQKNGRFYWTFSNAAAVMWLLRLLLLWRLLRAIGFYPMVFGLNGSNPGLHWISSNRIRQNRPYSKKIGDLIGCFPMERSYLQKNGRFYWTFSNAAAVMWLLPLRLLRAIGFYPMVLA
ncbi:hypothetical protein PAE9249_02706 [Paenibacillus sp. CECT 9249]|nr:hypothetical protein PAE9249_02706 [Paenibacillus sp. CECT 9249]